ncbi:MAG: hypothetical protein AAF297_09565 [Planctomycetota bacterium]
MSIAPANPIPLVRPPAAQFQTGEGVSAELLNAQVQARNDRIIGDVLDQSIEKAAQRREERAERDRERREAERAEAERQQERREQFRRIEREDAEQLAKTKRAEAETVERREGDAWQATLLRERADRIESAAALDTTG